VIVNVLPDIDPGPETTLNAMGFPDAPPLAVSVIGPTP
jgi:hypothetical protein